MSRILISNVITLCGSCRSWKIVGSSAQMLKWSIFGDVGLMGSELIPSLKTY